MSSASFDDPDVGRRGVLTEMLSDRSGRIRELHVSGEKMLDFTSGREPHHIVPLVEEAGEVVTHAPEPSFVQRWCMLL